MIKKDKKMKKKWKKKLEENCNFPKNEKLQFSSGFFHFFFICLSFFIIFASSGAKIFRKIKKCNFPRVFFIFFPFFYHFFIICLSFFIIFLSFSIIFHHFSSIPPLEAKMIKND